MEPNRNERFESLFREHYAAVRGYALRRAPRDVAPDVVAETFLVAWRRLDDVPADALPWLYGVARRVLANARRSADRGLALERRLAAAAVPAGLGDPGERVGEAEIVRAALARLTERDRETLMLVAWDGLSSARAARAAGCLPRAAGQWPCRSPIAGGDLMRPERDPMQRLAAADPLRDGERLTPEEEREAEALLARLLSTPADGRKRRDGGRRRVRRWTLAAAAVVGAAAAALAATSLVDSDAPGGGIVERAVAAMTRDDVIYHVVERSHTRASFEPGGDRTHYVESWYTSDGRIHQRTFAAKGGRKGRLLEDWAGRRIPGRRVNPRLRWDAWTNTISEGGFGPGPDTGAPGIDPFADRGAQLRRLQAEGRLRVAGTTRVGHRSAYRLVSGPVSDPEVDGVERVEFLVDADTYLPLAERFWSRSRSTDPEHPISRIRVVIRFLVYERLPLNERNRAFLDLDPHPGAKCSQFAGELRGDKGVGFPNPCPPPE